jgi:16S rRNA (guanine966-N2)-methyltransferase
MRALASLAREGRRFDLAFLDPPYESDLYEAALDALGRLDLLALEGDVVAEHFHKRPLPETIGALVRHRQVRVGDHCLSFYRRAR